MSKQTIFIAKVVPGAQAMMKKYGVLASLTIAQSIAESGWGAHAPGNMLFGIKANGWSGKTQILTTKEEKSDGTYETIKALFRAYDSWADSITDHGSFIAKNSRYKNIIGVTDYTTVCNYIKADGYATESDYATSLIALIEQHSLSQYDTLPTNLHVDVPAQNSAISKSQNVTFCGWSISPVGMGRVDIYVDGKTGLASLGLSNRADVEAAANGFGYYKNTLKSGFSYTLPAGKLKAGKHSIDFMAIDAKGNVQAGHRYITVK